MKTNRKWWGLIVALFCSISVLQADEWWEKREFLTYSPRYFGPNAFPFPELMGGKLPSRWEVEVRGEYHTMPGDTGYLCPRLYPNCERKSRYHGELDHRRMVQDVGSSA